MSHLTQQTIEKIKEIDITCGICMEILIEPTSLNTCGHTYCIECITKYRMISHSVDFPCPVCKKETHICSISEFKPNHIITQLIETLNPKGYKRRKREYFAHKKMYVLFRQYIGSQKCQDIMTNIEALFDEHGHFTMPALIRSMRTILPDVVNINLEVKIVLSLVLNSKFIIIHGKNMLKSDPRKVSSYIQENIHSMSAVDVAELVKPFSGLNYEIETPQSGLKKRLHNFQEENLEKIYEYLFTEYYEYLNPPEPEPESDETRLPMYQIRGLNEVEVLTPDLARAILQAHH